MPLAAALGRPPGGLGPVGGPQCQDSSDMLEGAQRGAELGRDGHGALPGGREGWGCAAPQELLGQAVSEPSQAARWRAGTGRSPQGGAWQQDGRGGDGDTAPSTWRDRRCLGLPPAPHLGAPSSSSWLQICQINALLLTGSPPSNSTRNQGNTSPRRRR